MASPYPLTGFFFQVKMTGIVGVTVDSGFAEVTGLDVSRELVELTEGGENQMVHQLPGRMKQSNLVLKRGLLGITDSLYRWCQVSLESDLEQPFATRDLEIALLTSESETVMTWDCHKAWPVKWSVAGLNAKEGQVVMETIEFAYQRLTRNYHVVKRSPTHVGHVDASAASTSARAR